MESTFAYFQDVPVAVVSNNTRYCVAERDQKGRAVFTKSAVKPVIHSRDIGRHAQAHTDSIRSIPAYAIGFEFCEQGACATRCEVGRRP